MTKLQTQARSAASITQGICVDPEKHLIKYLASSQKKQPCPAISHSSQFLHSQFNSHPLSCNSKSPTRGPALRVLWTLPTCPQASYQAAAQQEWKQERPDLWPKKQLLGTSGLPILCLISENPQESNLSLLKLISYLEFEIKRQVYLQIKEIDGEIKKSWQSKWTWFKLMHHFHQPGSLAAACYLKTTAQGNCCNLLLKALPWFPARTSTWKTEDLVSYTHSSDNFYILSNMPFPLKNADLC